MATASVDTNPCVRNSFPMTSTVTLKEDDSTETSTVKQFSSPAQFSRQISLRERTWGESVADFFGVGVNSQDEMLKWKRRSLKLARQKSIGGQVKPELERSATYESLFDPANNANCNSGAPNALFGLSTNTNGHAASPYDPLAIPRLLRQESHFSRGELYLRQLSRQQSMGSSKRASKIIPLPRRRDSVMRMAYDGIKTSLARQNSKRKSFGNSRSFSPYSISSFEESDNFKIPGSTDYLEDSVDEDIFFDLPTPTSPYFQGFFAENEIQTDSTVNPFFANVVLPTVTEDDGNENSNDEVTSESKDVNPFFADLIVSNDEDNTIGNDSPSSNVPLESNDVNPYSQDAILATLSENNVGNVYSNNNIIELCDEEVIEKTTNSSTFSANLTEKNIFKDNNLMNGVIPSIAVKPASPQTPLSPLIKDPWSWMLDAEDARNMQLRSGWQVPPNQDLLSRPSFIDSQQTSMRRIFDTVIDNAMDNCNRRAIGMGIVGNMFNRTIRTERINSQIRHQLDELDDHRPFFTYWITFVQIAVYIISILVYGIAPLGFQETEIRGEVMMISLAIEQVSYFEQDNFWIGPRQGDLIHMGAKYSPCMRRDRNVEDAIQLDRVIENNSACCIRNDGSGCVQTDKKDCSETLSTWYKWNGDSSENNYRNSGSVCGLDPRFCKHPLTTGAHKWKESIIDWPRCSSPSAAKNKAGNMHMTCEVIGRPCCIGLQGLCIMATREFCHFKHGYFHSEARLCSQVSCMSEVCGMVPFLKETAPDQFYRLWTTLFLHAGLLQLAVSVIFQYFVMRDLEKLTGWLRISIIYIGSGIAGSLSSSIFLPYHVEAGPSGAQFGLLACLFVEVIQNWYILKHPWHSIGKLAVFVFVLFVVGLLPMVDNYAHLVGFIFGFLLSFALLPYVSFGTYDRHRKLALVIVSLLVSMGIFSLLIVLFYIMPIYNCPYCHYFNCIPFTYKFCANMEVKIGRHSE